MPLALLVNPHSAGGRALKHLPRVEAALDAARVGFRVQRTRSLEHGVEAALARHRRRRAAGGDERRRPDRRGRRRDGRRRDAARHHSRRPRQRPRPRARHPRRSGGGAGHRPRRAQPPDRRRRGQRQALPLHRQQRLRLGRQRLANRTRLPRGSFVYAYAALVTLARWKPARFTLQRRRRAPAAERLLGRGRQQQGLRRRHVRRPRTPSSTTASSTSSTSARSRSWRFASNLPKVFKGKHVEDDAVTVFRAQHLELSASRPFAVYADGEHLTELPASLRVLPRALGVLVPEQAEA